MNAKRTLAKYFQRQSKLQPQKLLHKHTGQNSLVLIHMCHCRRVQRAHDLLIAEQTVIPGGCWHPAAASAMLRFKHSPPQECPG